MYLFITEDGEIFKSETVSESDKKASDDGILDIIDTDNLTTYLNHQDDEWEF